MKQRKSLRRNCKRNVFADYHPAVNFAFFVVVMTVTAIVMHPLIQTVSFTASFAYLAGIRGLKSVLKTTAFLFPLALFAIGINMIFNHEGVTILTYLPDGNPLTAESVAAGVGSVVSIMTVIVWFLCYSEVMTSDKLIYLFGRVLPVMSLTLSMTLRFVPLYKKKYLEVAEANGGLAGKKSQKLILKKISGAVRTTSIVMTWALENAVETADSMKSRGYGLPSRTAYSIYDFYTRDKYALAFCAYSAYMVVAVTLSGGFHWRYFPSVRSVSISPIAALTLILFGFLCYMPLIINDYEERVWLKNL